MYITMKMETAGETGDPLLNKSESSHEGKEENLYWNN